PRKHRRIFPPRRPPQPPIPPVTLAAAKRRGHTRSPVDGSVRGSYASPRLKSYVSAGRALHVHSRCAAFRAILNRAKLGIRCPPVRHHGGLQRTQAYTRYWHSSDSVYRLGTRDIVRHLCDAPDDVAPVQGCSGILVANWFTLPGRGIGLS